jgi:hypothetical protein
MKVIHASTGRSGSKTFAHLMNECGVPFTHETVWGTDGLDGPMIDGVVGESSAWVIPHLHHYTHLPVWHQVRDPRKVIASLHAGQWLDAAGRRLWPSYDRTVESCCRYWVARNLMVEHHPRYRRFRFEDMGPELVVDLLGELGVTPPDHVTELVNELLVSGIESRGRPEPVWPDSRWTEAVFGMARRYGYDL